MDIKKEIEIKNKKIAKKKNYIIDKARLRTKLCTNLTFKILVDASKQSKNKLETVFLKEMIKKISDSTWLLANGKVVHPKGYKNIDKRYRERDNLPYSFVVLGIEANTNNLKNLYEIIFIEKEGKIFQDSFRIVDSKTDKLILSIENIKKQ